MSDLITELQYRIDKPSLELFTVSSQQDFVNLINCFNFSPDELYDFDINLDCDDEDEYVCDVVEGVFEVGYYSEQYNKWSDKVSGHYSTALEYKVESFKTFFEECDIQFPTNVLICYLEEFDRNGISKVQVLKLFPTNRLDSAETLCNIAYTKGPEAKARFDRSIETERLLDEYDKLNNRNGAFFPDSDV